MMKNIHACPVCAQDDRSYKVSLLYLAATARLNRRETTNQPELDAVMADVLPKNSSAIAQSHAVYRMEQMFAPPAGQRQVTRRIHPDWLIFFLFGIGLFMLFDISRNQPSSLPAFLALVAVSLLVYIILRKPITRRYTALQSEEAAEKARVERAIARWMRLYYCSRDQIVFDPEENQFVPLEQIADLVHA